ncbi:MAG: hypothetical protein DHS20C17_27410 [Cyclobacteriaceae bacterium]|nr:MAG: hypothetical protein DHS20C17_27410 [Cyclobacteriaceae bacterium]
MACAPDEICFTDNGTTVGIDFQRVVYPGTDSAFLENDTLIFYQVTALETDSIFLALDTLSSLVLPVNTGKNQTTFLFDTNRGNHQLELKYDRTERLISVDCGAEQIIGLLEAEVIGFDSASVLQPALTQPANTNVEIYN